MRSLSLLALVWALSACSPSRPPLADLDALRSAREARQAAYTVARADVAERLAARVAARVEAGAPPVAHVLLLSGGGQHGAFGAGFLNGWLEAGSLPRFDVVTGISTGSLLAPFAFEGTPEALRRAADLYRHPERIAPARDLWGALFRRSGGLFDVSPLVQTAAGVYDAPMAARLVDGFAENRQLFLGTTDLALGRGRVWDLSREIGPTPEGVRRFNTLLLASSAIPGAFPAVEIDGRLHTDGGVAANLLGVDLQLLRALGDALARRGVRSTVDVQVYAVVNLTLAPPVAAVDGGRFQDVDRRAGGLLFALHQQETLVRLWELAEGVRAGSVPGLTMSFRYAAIPDAWSAEPAFGALFDAPYMARLQDYATARGRQTERWDPLPPGPFE